MLATGNFLRNGKILFLVKIIAFLNLENTANYSMRANFNRNSPKINFKIYHLLHFFKLEPWNFVFMTKTKRLSDQIFDLGPRSENSKF